MNTIKNGLFLVFTVWLSVTVSYAGNKGNKEEEGYKFELIKEIPHTPG